LDAAADMSVVKPHPLQAIAVAVLLVALTLAFLILTNMLTLSSLGLITWGAAQTLFIAAALLGFAEVAVHVSVGLLRTIQRRQIDGR
jgi:hypothetical protein